MAEWCASKSNLDDGSSSEKLPTFRERTVAKRRKDRKNKIRKTKPKRDVIYVGKHRIDYWDISGPFLMDMPSQNVVRFIDPDIDGLEISMTCKVIFGRPTLTKTDAKHLEAAVLKAERIYWQSEYLD